MNKWWTRTQARGTNTTSHAPQFVKVETQSSALSSKPDPVVKASPRLELRQVQAAQPTEGTALLPIGFEALLAELGKDAGLADPRLEQALYKEAQDAEGPFQSGAAPLAQAMEPSPTPEMEMAFIEEAIVAEEPPEPMEEPPFPALSEPEDQPWLGESIKVGSPPPETSDIVRGVLPPRPQRMVFGLAETTLAATTLASGAALNQPSDLAEWETSDTAANEPHVAEGRLRLDEFNQQIDAVYDRVSVEVGTNRRLSASCFQELRTARDLVLRHDLAGLPQAEYHLQQVQVRLQQAEESGAALRKYGWRIMAWGLLCGALLLTALSLLRLGLFDGYLALAVTGQLLGVKVEILLSTMLWAGIGGVAAIWYGLFKHLRRRDFDPQYNLSYLGKPFFGLVLGGILYTAGQLLNLLLGIWPGPLLSGLGWPAMSVIAPSIIYVLACICGFQEDRLFDYMDRAVKRIFSEQSPKADLQNPSPVV